MALHSATKFLGGHGDVLAGIVVCKDEAWANALRQVRILTGAVLHPQAAWLLHRSLPTLPMRVLQAQANAIEVANWLRQQPEVERVMYPDNDQIAKRQMDGPGSLLVFELSGGFDAAAALMGTVKLCTPAVSLGSNDSLIQHPAGLTHRILSDEAREQGGITSGLMRLSVGIENAEDIIADLAQALNGSALIIKQELVQ